MKKLTLLLALGVWITSFAQIDRDQLSLDISKADAANTEQLKAFIWKKSSVVTVDGEVKLTTLSEFKFDKNGELQMQNIDAQTTVKQKRGIRGKIQENAAEENLEYVEEALKMMMSYTYMSKASGALFSYVDLEERIPARHPLRKIRQVVNDALASLDADFAALYIDFGRPSIPPERLIRASLLQILFSIRSERQVMEQMDYNLMLRWFVGLGIDDPVWGEGRPETSPVDRFQP